MVFDLCLKIFGDRLMVGHQVLVLTIEVRILVPEPKKLTSENLFFLFCFCVWENYDRILVNKTGFERRYCDIINDNKETFMKYFIITPLILLAFWVAFSIINSQEREVIKLVANCAERSAKNCQISDLPYMDKNLDTEARVKDLLKRMTLEEKIGQMMLVERASVKNPEDISNYGIGALLSGMGSKPDPNTKESWQKMINKYLLVSKSSRLGIPILYGIDGIHGHSHLTDTVIFPHFIGLGATNDVDLVRRVALATTEQLAATGIYWNFSPNLDVPSDPRWGRFYESFGSRPKLVARLGQAYTEGINEYNLDDYHPIGTAKHFIGAGAMEWGSSYNKNFQIDQGESIMTETELRFRHLPSFQAAIEAGIKSVMVGLNSWENKKLSENKYLIDDLLKGELGFEGIVVSDWYGVYEIDQNKYKAMLKAVQAGIDMQMLPFEYKLFMQDVFNAVKKGDLSEERIDESVARILKVKFDIGLFDNEPVATDLLRVLDSKEHQALAREAVRKSLTILKNENKLLPISPKTKIILVAGDTADNLGKQLGAWSVEWQGIDGNWTEGTSILAGIEEVGQGKHQITFDLEGDFPNQTRLADIGLIVVGEKPYAEGWGDKANLQLEKSQIELIKKMKLKAKKVVLIIVSGRSLDIKNISKDLDAIVAVWLPGSEGGGVADVLFGAYPFNGTLSIPWEI